LLSAGANNLQAAITWDSLGQTMGGNPTGSTTQWWFDPANWSHQVPGEAPPLYLPPSNDGATAETDVQINEGTAGLPGGAGVVYDPTTNDPNFANAGSLTYPPGGFGPQTIWRLYVSRNTVNHNLLTVRGNLTAIPGPGGGVNWQIGRSGSTGTLPAQQNEGRLNHESGIISIDGDLDLGQREASGWGNGIYDYRGGTLIVAPTTSGRLRLSAGGSAGAGGHGRFIVHNPDSGGYIRTRTFEVAAFGGDTGTSPANGDTTGVGIVEFHFENDGTRPVQVRDGLILNNGQPVALTSTRSSRLDLTLDEAPCAGDGCVPVDLGLFDVDFGDTGFGLISGALSLGATFSNAAMPSQVYTEGSTVSALFGGTRYDWQISYSGHITWTDADNSVVDEILGAGNGTDVVLMGLGSEFVGVPGLAGDYNDDGVVDAVDYTVWRNNLGDADETNLNNNGDGNDVSASDYTYWKDRYGDVAPPGAGGLAGSVVPEPSAVLLSLLAAVGVTCASRRGRATV
jgi:hypothetical protein